MRSCRAIVLVLLAQAACFSPEDGNGAAGISTDASSTSGASATASGNTDPSGPSSNGDPSAPTSSDPSAPTTEPSTDPTSASTDPDSTGPSDPSTTSDPTSATTTDTGPLDTEPPTLQFGAFLDSTHIRLTFSEPIDSVAGVNPAKFRPSESWWDSDDSGMVYLDLLNDFPDDNCPCITGAGLENDPGDEYTIILELDAPTNADTCTNASLNYLPVMHYDADTLATAEHIRDLAGNVLAEFGGVFVESPGESSMTLPADQPFPDFPLGGVLLDFSAICG
ncbi:MAG: hypothetical protein JNK45_10760 [Myxococcales bacterium]|nr:hypothetical protein [Myxococcales bacterium]